MRRGRGQQRRSGSQQTTRVDDQPPGRSGAAVAAALAVAAVVLVVLVTASGNVPLATEGSGGWHLDRRGTPTEPRQLDDQRPISDLPAESRIPGEGVLAVIAQTVVIVLGVTAVLLIGRTLLRLSRREPEPFDPLPEEHWPQPAAEMTDAVEEGLAALTGGPVDEVIVACWVRLEEAAAAAGVGRRAAETSSELAARVLADLDAPEAAVEDLLRRYRQARYSHHSLDEADRAAAVGALEEIRTAIAGAHA